MKNRWKIEGYYTFSLSFFHETEKKVIKIHAIFKNYKAMISDKMRSYYKYYVFNFK